MAMNHINKNRFFPVNHTVSSIKGVYGVINLNVYIDYVIDVD